MTRTGILRNFLKLSFVIYLIFDRVAQGCGSGSGWDPDLITLWIRICIGNPDPGSGSRGKGMKKKKYSFVNNIYFFITKRYKNSSNC
jgi:hypothetical protein